MKAIRSFWSGGVVNKVIVGIVALLSACSFCNAVGALGNLLRPAPVQPAGDPAIIGTSIIETFMASVAETSTAAITATSIPTNTLAETFTAIPTSTLEPLATSTSVSVALPSGISCIPTTVPPQTGRVAEVVDGDTIKVLLDADGLIYSIRYIGIDTPENTSAKEYFGPESSAKNFELVAGKSVALYTDLSDKDRYGRLLRYVVADGIFVNYELVVQGYATSVSYPPDTACQAAFNQAQQSATTAKIGLWAGPTPTLLPVVGPGGTSENPVCVCSGNAYNCSDFGSHSAAQACYNYCISKGAGDVHKLDSDSDGSACESLP